MPIECLDMKASSWAMDAVDAPSPDDQRTTYTYGDSNAGTKQTSKTVQQGPGYGNTLDLLEQHTYVYDASGRMTEVTIDKTPSGGDVTTVEYGYDSRDLRVEETTGVDVRTYLFDVNNLTGYAKPIEEYLNGTLDKTYTLGHQIIMQFNDEHGLLYFLQDGHGSTRALVSGYTAAIEQVFASTAFGETLEGEGLTSAEDAYTTLLRADGSYDRVTGFTHQQYRDLAGWRYIVPDPWGNARINNPITLNSYLYGNANPVMNIDPLGLFSIASTIKTISISTVLGGSLGFGLTGSVKGAAYGALGGLSFGTSIALILANPTNIVAPQLKGQDFAALAFTGFFGALLGFVDYVIETGGRSAAEDRAWEYTIRGFATATTGFATSYGLIAVLPHWSGKVNALVSQMGPRETSAAGAFIGTIASVTASGKIINNTPRALLDVGVNTAIAYAGSSIADTVLTDAVEGYLFSLVAKLYTKIGIGYFEFFREYAK